MGFNIVDSLISSESSGNPNAYIKIKDGREFFGLGQLGIGRLKELGLGNDFTLDQYKTDENLQRNLLERDVQNTRDFITSHGLNEYYGTEINGMPFTENAAIAIAHLGGRGGLQKYVTSGGKYNPADELGTSLSDYHRKHGVGGPTIANASGTPRSDGAQPPSRESLKGFQEDMTQGAGTSRSLLQHAIAQIPGMETFAQDASMGSDPITQLGGQTRGIGLDPNADNLLPPGANSGPGLTPNSPNLLPPQTQNSPGMTPDVSVFQEAGEDVMPVGIPPELMEEVAAAVDQGMSVDEIKQNVGQTLQAAEEQMPGRVGIMQKLGEFFHPNVEDPERQFRDTLGAIGVGLGQMSHGQPVNLQPYFNGIAQRRQAVIDAKNDEHQRLIDNKLRAGQLAVQEAQLGISQQKANISAGELAHKIRKEGMEGGYDYSEIAKMYPELVDSGMIGLAQAGDKDAQKAITEHIDEKIASGLDTPEMQQAYRDYAAAPDAGARYDAIKHLPQSQQDRIMDMYQKTNDEQDMPGAVDLGRYLYQNDPDSYESEADAVRKAAKLQAGSPDGLDPEVIKMNVKQGNEVAQTYATAANAAIDRMFSIDTAIHATEKAIAEGKELDATTSDAGIGLGQLIGGIMGTEAAAKFYDKIGIMPEEYQEMTLAQQQMMSAIARSWTGQGSISDKEREQMAREVLHAGLTNQSMMVIGAKLKAAAMIDLSNSRHYRNNVDKANAYQNWYEVQGDIENAKSEASDIIRAAGDRAMHDYFMNENVTTPEAEQYRAENGDDMEYLNALSIPRTSEAAANMYKNALPIRKDPETGKMYYIWKDINDNLHTIPVENS